jgi:ATP-dependent exoDNAse (exonuclease V) beta subunit
VHGAKGLEYPIVALANLSAQNPNHAQPVPCEQQRFLHFRVGAGTVGRHGHFKTHGYDKAWEREKEQVEAGRRRLLYVGATRAREHLIVPCVTGLLGAKGLLSELALNLPLEDRDLVSRVALADIELPAPDEAPPRR